MTSPELENSTPTLEMDRNLIAGRYRPLDRIGSGRLGEIFEAVDEDYDDLGVKRRLAIQVVPEDIVRNNKLFNMLNVGYSVLRAAAHPNIVKFLHFGRHGKRGFLLMELLDGASLRTVLANAGTLPPDEVKPVIRSIGDALQLLHSQDMVHGNLTAANVFFTDALEVRLLDVLPLGADQAVVRGGATSSPFSRCTVRDDVFGLACLAYEMLTGKHPFNHSPPAEAAQAGLEAPRIDSLGDAEWDALSRGLSLDHQLRTASVEDFLRDFGVTGTERLQPAGDPAIRHEPASDQEAYVAEPVAKRVAEPPPAPAVEPVAPVVTDEPVIAIEELPRNARPARKRAGARRTVLLAMLLAALGAWTYYGQPEEQVAGLLGQLDETLVAAWREQQNPPADAVTPVTETPVVAENEIQDDVPAAAASTIDVDTTVADDVEAMDSEPEVAPSNDIAPDTAAEAIDDTPAAPSQDDPAAADIEATARATDAAPPDSESSDTQPRTDTQTRSDTAFSQPIVTVSERDGAVQISVPPTGYTSSPKIWWTSEHSAIAGDDFIAIEEQPMPDASVEGGAVLIVPLVNDSLPEPPESFFVSLGFRDPRQGHIERIATVRVDIIDDD